MGSQLAFVNAVAESVAARYPGKQVGTLSYWHTRKPPAHLRPGTNVQIQLANIECCALHSLAAPACPKNADFLADLTAWCGIADQVYRLELLHRLSLLRSPLSELPEHRTEPPPLRRPRREGRLRAVARREHRRRHERPAQLRHRPPLWNPYLDGWSLVEEFCRLHYGAAGDEILAYLVRLHDRAGMLGIHPACFATPEELGLDASFAREMMERFARARAIAERQGPDYVARVEKASLTAYRAHDRGGRAARLCRRERPAGLSASARERRYRIPGIGGRSRPDRAGREHVDGRLSRAPAARGGGGAAGGGPRERHVAARLPPPRERPVGRDDAQAGRTELPARVSTPT